MNIPTPASSSSFRKLAAASLGAALLAGMPLSALAAATLYVVEGSGEFQSLQTSVFVTTPKALTMQWSTDQTGAAGGTWKVLNSANQVVASGEATPAPGIGKALRFTIPQNAFLLPSVASSTKFTLSIQPHDGVMKAMGAASPHVTVSQEPSTNTPAPVFGAPANYPQVEIVSYVEKIGVVPQTQIEFAGADVVVRVTNKSTKASDPAWLTLKDGNVLMRQGTGALSVPVLLPGASTTLSVHLDAILPVAPTLPQQFNLWGAKHHEACGPLLSSVLDWRGPASQAPMGDHLERFLVQEGFGDYAKVSPNVPICKDGQCVKVCQIEKNIQAQLDNKVMGYSYFVGTYPKFGSGGKARTSANGWEVPFRPDTKITVASVSKLVTTIAAVRLIDQKAASMPMGIDTKIGPYMPSDWAPKSSHMKNLTFAQLLSQQSGIKDYGNIDMDYETLKKFFTQSVDATASTACQGSDVKNPANPVNPSDLGRCYSNYNFAIMRVLLPKVAGFAEDPNVSTRPATLAGQYVKLIQQHVFDPVGRFNVLCKPPVGTSNYALAYRSATSLAKGSDFGDVSGVCGGAGVYLSAHDMAAVMLSLNAGDGKILSASGGKDLFKTMRTRQLGWDVRVDTEVEKNGLWGTNCDADKVCDLVSTSVAQFGPVTGPRVPGVLFLNSAITGGGNAQSVLEKAYYDAIYTP